MTHYLTRQRLQHFSIGFLVGLLLPYAAPWTFTPRARAVDLAQAYLRLDRMSASTATTGRVCVKLANAAEAGGPEANVEVTFPASFTVSTTLTDWSVDTSNLLTGENAMPTPAQATNVNSKTVRFPIGDMTTTNLYCFNFTNTAALTTGGAGTDLQASLAVTNASNTVLESTKIAVAVITSDNIEINAAVPPTFTMILTGNSQALGNLNTSSIISGAGSTVEIRTNAKNGWYSWIKSAHAAIYSDSKNYSIATLNAATPDTVVAGTQGYVLDVDKTLDSLDPLSGTVTIAADFDGTGVNQGGTLDATQYILTASANGPTDSDIITLIPRVTISGLTPAADDYHDDLTVVASGAF